MLETTTIDFLKNLKKNNNKAWFDENRSKYEASKTDFTSLVAQVIKDLSKMDIRYESLEAKKCIFRLNRDVRFSKNKSPYKTNFGASFSIGGKKSGNAGFYFHIEPENNFIGGGIWMPEADTLKKIRQEIDYNFKDFEKIITTKDFIKYYQKLSEDEKLKNPPKGYDKENIAIEYLKLKSFVVGAQLNDNDLIKKDLSKKIHEHFKVLMPFIQFLNQALHS